MTNNVNVSNETENVRWQTVVAKYAKPDPLFVEVDPKWRTGSIDGVLKLSPVKTPTNNARIHAGRMG